MLLLMNAKHPFAGAYAVVTSDDDRDGAVEALDLRLGDGKAKLGGQRQAEVLVLRVVRQVGNIRLQDMRRRDST